MPLLAANIAAAKKRIIKPKERTSLACVERFRNHFMDSSSACLRQPISGLLPARQCFCREESFRHREQPAVLSSLPSNTPHECLLRLGATAGGPGEQSAAPPG